MLSLAPATRRGLGALNLTLESINIPCHTIPKSRLRAHTIGYLLRCSIPDIAVGGDDSTVLSGSLRLSSYARELLPVGAGGAASTSLDGLSPATRDALASTMSNLRRRLESTMHLEDFSTPTEGKAKPDARGTFEPKKEPKASRCGTWGGASGGGCRQGLRARDRRRHTPQFRVGGAVPPRCLHGASRAGLRSPRAASVVVPGVPSHHGSAANGSGARGPSQPQRFSSHHDHGGGHRRRTTVPWVQNTFSLSRGWGRYRWGCRGRGVNPGSSTSSSTS